MIEEEAEELRGELADLIAWLADSADDLVSHTNRRGVRSEIWALDDEELAVIVEFLIERGKRAVVAAQAVRGAVNLWKQYQIGVILAPRVWETSLFYYKYGLGLNLAEPTPIDELPEEIERRAREEARERERERMAS